jgi:quercetin dioxygenase-like cupin family protein
MISDMKSKTIRLSVGVFLLLSLVAIVAIGQRSTPSVVRVKTDQLKWVDEPNGLGFKTAIVEGDPAKPGLYIIQVKFPPGVMSRPHSHREDRYGTVIKGTWWTGSGNEFTPDKTIPLKPGDFMKHPAGVNHFDGAKDEEVIVQLIGMGPSQTTRVQPELGLFDHSVKK